MSRKLHSIFTIVAVALLALGTSGCVEPLDDSSRPVVDTNSRDLTIRLYMPGAMPATKAGTGDVNSVSPESALYNIQVWMFDHVIAGANSADNQKAIAYSEITDIWTNTYNLPSGSGYYTEDPYWGRIYTYEVKLSIPGYFLDRDASQMKVDFYVLANGPSIGNPANRDMTRKQLRDMQFGGSYFGTATPATEVPETGLPISGFFNKTNGSGNPADGVDISFLKTTQEITPTLIHQNMPIVQLERAVAKIRFAFVRPKGMAGVQITKIVIDEKLIPDNTFVFPRENGTDGTSDYSYNTAATTIQGSLNGNTRLPLLADTDIKEMTDAVPDPKSLESTSGTAVPGYSVNVAPKNMSAQQYSDLLNAFATSQFVYLRESGKKIKGKIYYKLSADGDETSAVFEMDADDDDTNFYRNHSWIVYAYFQGGALYIKPVVLPWKDGGSYPFTTPGTAFVSLSNNPLALFGYGWTTSTENTWYTAGKLTEWYFRRQNPENGDLTDPDYWKNDWVHSQMVVAPGLNLGNAPIFANRIELTTLGFSESLILKLSDPEHFELVIYHSDSADYEVVNDPNGAVIPATVTTEGITYFYVVPKDGSDNLNLSVSAYLITENSGQMIPFNANAFPGSNENTGIYFYSVSQDTFKGYYNTLPENVKAYDKDGEITI